MHEEGEIDEPRRRGQAGNLIGERHSTHSDPDANIRDLLKRQRANAPEIENERIAHQTQALRHLGVLR